MKKCLCGLNLVLLMLAIGCSTSDSDFAIEGDSNIGAGDDQSGLITAGEWNDLDNWGFWKDLLTKDDFSSHSSDWEFYTDNRFSVLVKDGDSPIIDVKVEIRFDNNTSWEARTDNFGKAELFVNLYQESKLENLNNFTLFVDDQLVDIPLTLFEDGVIEIPWTQNQSVSPKVELAFIVDATGSMSDELEFLKDDLESVIQKVEQDNSALDIRTGAVFYRDTGEEYLVRKSDLTDDINTSVNFIDNQSASGGGDFPEAVHAGLSTAIDEFDWSEKARTRIAFLILDAPPHHNSQVIFDLQEAITSAARKGIKVIPITASGIDKGTEFLMRFFSISTNGTYVFITNDSGIGEDHIEASVGDYEVEFLNNLMVRLIKKYSD